MSQRLDVATLRDASAVLERLAGQVEDGTLSESGYLPSVSAAAWRGAADALGLAASSESGQDG